MDEDELAKMGFSWTQKQTAKGELFALAGYRTNTGSIK
jgi:hypothetical protein